MKAKFLLFGESVNIPHSSIGLGLGLVSVWFDGNGFTSASNNIGALGYIFLETPEVDIGEVNTETHRAFSNLHGKVLNFQIQPNIFVKNGGIARIAMSIQENEGGAVVEKRLDFIADECTGISIVSNALVFSATMLQTDRQLAELDSANIVSGEELEEIANAAPPTSDSAFV